VAKTGNMEKCTPEECFINIDSEDEIGESGQAFNYLVEALASSHKNDVAVRSFTELLSSQLELDVLTNQALQQLLQHTEADAGAILIADEGELKIASSHGIRSVETIITSDHVRRAIQTAKRQIVQMPENITVDGVLANFRPREIIVDPVLYKGIPLGVIILASAKGFSDEIKSRLDPFSQGLSLAMNNALAHDRLQRLAALDPLTNIYNRRFGLARLHEEFGRAVRNTSPIGVLMFDIDHFKNVNDTYGHLTGDRVLISVAKAARSVMREGDILVRYGGEEFLAIMPAASKANAKEMGERMRRIIEDTTISDGDQVIQVTVSVGTTSYPELDVAGEQELIKSADTALYSAKESGRNRVVAI
jgi:two-component system cell cycle response regulator